eukprot:6203545-Pleurochrysis_carterae.AAC.3
MSPRRTRTTAAGASDTAPKTSLRPRKAGGGGKGDTPLHAVKQMVCSVALPSRKETINFLGNDYKSDPYTTHARAETHTVEQYDGWLGTDGCAGDSCSVRGRSVALL